MSRESKDWFTVDKDGLAKLLEQKGKAFAVFELWQNAMDEDTHEVKITLRKLKGSTVYAELIVEDDSPDGFKDLRHAFTLFAESSKKGDPKKRGFMNFGEKLVIACCRTAIIETTTGTVAFNADGTRITSGYKRKSGSIFTGEIRMTQAELEEVLRATHRLIPPPNKITTINGERLPLRERLAAFEAPLPTRAADAEGVMIKTVRTTRVDIYEPKPGEVPSLYEMGIPVVETNDRWHVDIQQKVPLNFDRDNVPPAYLRAVRTLVLNELHSKLTAEEVTAPWVRDAASSDKCSDQAITKVLSLRYGDQRVAADPSDREAEGTAKAHGYSVVHGGSLSAGEWANARRADAIPAAGRAFPTPKPFHPDGEPLKLLAGEDTTDDHRDYVAFVEACARELLGFAILVQLVDDKEWGFGGTYGSGLMRINVAAFSKDFFANPASAESIAFILHELAHSRGHHLDASYHEALTEMGGKLVALALRSPDFFQAAGK